MTSSPLSQLEIDVSVLEPDWPRELAECSAGSMIGRCLAAALEVAGISLERPAEISIVLANDEKLRELNARWRGRNRPTNVLSFSQIPPFSRPEGLLGDIVLALETIRKEAKEQHKPFQDHFAHLVVHGFMHILGYDHETDTQAERMERLEMLTLKRLGIDDPYRDLCARLT